MLVTVAWASHDEVGNPTRWTPAHLVDLDPEPFERLDKGVGEDEEPPDVFEGAPRRKALCGEAVPGRTRFFLALGSPHGVCPECEAKR